MLFEAGNFLDLLCGVADPTFTSHYMKIRETSIEFKHRANRVILWRMIHTVGFIYTAYSVV
jgi:hypothetical protein